MLLWFREKYAVEPETEGDSEDSGAESESSLSENESESNSSESDSELSSSEPETSRTNLKFDHKIFEKMMRSPLQKPSIKIHANKRLRKKR